MMSEEHIAPMNTVENRGGKELRPRKNSLVIKAAFAALTCVITKSFYIFHCILQIIIVTSTIFITAIYERSNKLTPKKMNQHEEEVPSSEEPEKDNVVCEDLSYQYKVLPPLNSPNRKTIFLDLDETLIHSMSDPPTQRFDFIVRPMVNGAVMNFYVVKRPGVDELLESLAAKFEVVIFTAGIKEYASLILDKLDPKGLISHRLYRDSCKFVEGRFVKDLSRMGRDLRKVVIVDDNPYSYLFQPWNGIPIRAFIDDRNDRELSSLAKFMDNCSCFDDMRDAVRCYHETKKKTSRFFQS